MLSQEYIVFVLKLALAEERRQTAEGGKSQEGIYGYKTLVFVFSMHLIKRWWYHAGWKELEEKSHSFFLPLLEVYGWEASGHVFRRSCHLSLVSIGQQWQRFVLRIAFCIGGLQYSCTALYCGEIDCYRRKRLSKRCEARIGTAYELYEEEDTRTKNREEKQIIVRLSTRDRSCSLFSHCTTHVRNMQHTHKNKITLHFSLLKNMQTITGHNVTYAKSVLSFSQEKQVGDRHHRLSKAEKVHSSLSFFFYIIPYNATSFHFLWRNKAETTKLCNMHSIHDNNNLRRSNAAQIDQSLGSERVC